ncbi:diacylglycerol/lipid kinase family protein [Robertkochia solimangrovi]|uniref:diacylglycerol/lipid kinase family protein n=1 Tax=Robertkochia solimangrovi TaxID=2213046 RepID=UPI00117E9EDC|nr:YegS/Rv2252/BmrU family lipid kinase [Robertkochia solimangrovi]TRZ42952.1 diacylglycerol kinase family lipid kinase [Robertkochia solimangrovi]
MINIHFIINPIAGSGKNELDIKLLREYFDAHTFNIVLKYSEYKGHAVKLTNDSIKDDARIIVACGGDGTINEVASTLIGTSILLGIIPIGSGNGLASNLSIPKNIKKALRLIQQQQFTTIDVGCVNNRYFFSNTGLGLPANVIEKYELSEKRTLLSYVRATFKSVNQYTKKEKLQIQINEKTTYLNPFLILISNSNEMGYNMSLTPKANLQDGLLDVIVIPEIKLIKMLYFGLCMLFRKPEYLKEALCFQSDHITLLRTPGSGFQSQIDGELVKFEDQKLTISIKERSLNVII